MSSSDSDSNCSDFDWEGFNDCVRSNALEDVKDFLEHPRFNVDNCEDDYTALLVAVEIGSIEMARLLLNAGYCVDEMSREGETPLGEAIRCQDLDMIKLLVEEFGADIENGNGTPGVIMAASEREMDMVKYFVDKGAEANSILNACYEAAKSRDTTILDYLYNLLEKHPSSKILVETARYGSKPALEYLLSKGVFDVNYETKKKDTALYVAVEKGNLECVNVLLEGNAQITSKILMKAFQQQRNVAVSTLIFETAKNKFGSCIDELATVTDSDGNTIIHLLVKQKSELALIMQVVKRFKHLLTSENTIGQTPLLTACKYSVSLETFMYLLNRSRACVKDYKGNTAIMYAARNGRLDMVTALVKRKVSVKRLKNGKGKTLLHKAVKSEKFELVEYLDQQGLLGDVNAKDNNLRTPLMGCKQSVPIVQLLETKGANVMHQDDAGNTIVHKVIVGMKSQTAYASITFIEDLVKLCDDIKTVRNAAGKTPLQLAKRHYSNGRLYKLLS